MKPKHDITAEALRAALHYDPETGVFTWKRWARKTPGDMAGWVARSGYVLIKMGGRRYMAHRLAWLYMRGTWPEFEIDHINGACADNRFANLRDVSTSVNQQNRRAAQSNSAVGRLGVARAQGGRRGFRAQIHVDGRQVFLGTFRSSQEAGAAYIAAKRELHAGCTL